jgi:ribosome-binding protein aMBF1 (putative translation factor)
MDECEFCGKNAEYDVLVDGNYVKLCKECVDKKRMVVVEKPTNIQVDESYKRPSVKQILMRLSGVKQVQKKNVVPTLDQLRKPKEPEQPRDPLRRVTISNKPTGTQILKKIEDKKLNSENIRFNKDEVESEEFIDL